MGTEHDKIRDQVRGALAGAEHELEVSERLLLEAQAKRDKFAGEVDELKAILSVHEQARP